MKYGTIWYDAFSSLSPFPIFHRTISYHEISYHTFSYCLHFLYFIVRYRTIKYRTILFLTVSISYISSYDIVPWNIVPYRTMLFLHCLHLPYFIVRTIMVRGMNSWIWVKLFPFAIFLHTIENLSYDMVPWNLTESKFWLCPIFMVRWIMVW